MGEPDSTRFGAPGLRSSTAFPIRHEHNYWPRACQWSPSVAGIRRAASFGSSWTAIVSAAEPVSLRSMCTRPPPGLAKGWTNRQIGQALFITEKTASLHVSHILAKLGVAGRGEAAAVAHRLGLDQQ